MSFIQRFKHSQLKPSKRIKAQKETKSLPGASHSWCFQLSRTLGLIFLQRKWCGNRSHYCLELRGVMSIQC